jgi:hypothetical protein
MMPHELTSESFEYSFGGEVAAETTLTEHEIQELAAELLEVSGEAELEQFLGKVFKKIGSGLKKVGGFVGKGLKTLGKGLKVMAPTLLSFAGKAVGSAFGGPLGGMIGSKLGSFAGNLIKKAEMEVAEVEEREFEAAKNFVRFADLAAQHLSRTPPGVDGEAAAMRAMERAAAQLAPAGVAAPARPVGRWSRRGRTIVVQL